MALREWSTLNLRKMNLDVEYHHFQMESLNKAIAMLSPNCFLASIDIKEAYHAINVAHKHRKYLRFFFQGQMYQLIHLFCEWVGTMSQNMYNYIENSTCSHANARPSEHCSHLYFTDGILSMIAVKCL